MRSNQQDDEVAKQQHVHVIRDLAAEMEQFDLSLSSIIPFDEDDEDNNGPIVMKDRSLLGPQDVDDDPDSTSRTSLDSSEGLLPPPPPYDPTTSVTTTTKTAGSSTDTNNSSSRKVASTGPIPLEKKEADHKIPSRTRSREIKSPQHQRATRRTARSTEPPNKGTTKLEETGKDDALVPPLRRMRTTDNEETAAASIAGSRAAKSGQANPNNNPPLRSAKTSEGMPERKSRNRGRGNSPSNNSSNRLAPRRTRSASRDRNNNNNGSKFGDSSSKLMGDKSSSRRHHRDQDTSETQRRQRTRGVSRSRSRDNDGGISITRRGGRKKLDRSLSESRTKRNNNNMDQSVSSFMTDASNGSTSNNNMIVHDVQRDPIRRRRHRHEGRDQNNNLQLLQQTPRLQEQFESNVPEDDSGGGNKELMLRGFDQVQETKISRAMKEVNEALSGTVDVEQRKKKNGVVSALKNTNTKKLLKKTAKTTKKVTKKVIGSNRSDKKKKDRKKYQRGAVGNDDFVDVVEICEKSGGTSSELYDTSSGAFSISDNNNNSKNSLQLLVEVETSKAILQPVCLDGGRAPSSDRKFDDNDLFSPQSADTNGPISPEQQEVVLDPKEEREKRRKEHREAAKAAAQRAQQRRLLKKSSSNSLEEQEEDGGVVRGGGRRRQKRSEAEAAAAAARERAVRRRSREPLLVYGAGDAANNNPIDDENNRILRREKRSSAYAAAAAAKLRAQSRESKPTRGNGGVPEQMYSASAEAAAKRARQRTGERWMNAGEGDEGLLAKNSEGDKELLRKQRRLRDDAMAAAASQARAKQKARDKVKTVSSDAASAAVRRTGSAGSKSRSPRKALPAEMKRQIQKGNNKKMNRRRQSGGSRPCTEEDGEYPNMLPPDLIRELKGKTTGDSFGNQSSSALQFDPASDHNLSLFIVNHNSGVVSSTSSHTAPATSTQQRGNQEKSLLAVEFGEEEEEDDIFEDKRKSTLVPGTSGWMRAVQSRMANNTRSTKS